MLRNRALDALQAGDRLDVRRFWEHVDECDFFDGELRFECDEVASEARCFTCDVEDESCGGGADVAGELGGEAVAGGIGR